MFGGAAVIWLLVLALPAYCVRAAPESFTRHRVWHAEVPPVRLIPLYPWYVLVAALMMVFAFPPPIVGSMLLEIERAAGWPFFDPTRGGDPLL